MRRYFYLTLALVALIGLSAQRAAAQVKLVTDPDKIFTPVFASDPEGAIREARQRIAAGDLDGAVGKLAVYVVAHPGEVGPARFLGDLYYRQGQLGKAEEVYRQLLRLNPKDKETHNRLGVVYATENRVDDAIFQF
ncbi:MAG TPA: tetratricopeptide repeat protein, partial [Candidatus Baltobacteraceae bacterium]|nr:tetratricopeptide repeat protein [Candidatus Baltobacteraceae bacterium]